MHLDGHLGCGLRVVDRRHGEHGGTGFRGLDGGARHGDGIALCHAPLVGLVGGVIGTHAYHIINIGGQIVTNCTVVLRKLTVDGNAGDGNLGGHHIDGERLGDSLLMGGTLRGGIVGKVVTPADADGDSGLAFAEGLGLQCEAVFTIGGIGDGNQRRLVGSDGQVADALKARGQERDVLPQLVADVNGLALIRHFHRLAGKLYVGGGVVDLDGDGGRGLRVLDRRGLHNGGTGLHGLDGGARHGDGTARCHTPVVGLVGGILRQHLNDRVQEGA